MSPIRIAARLEYATLEELEAGFAERLGEREVFLAHGSFGSVPEEPRVGAGVTVEITTASGETALALEGVIAWSYPPALVPPGREAGTGIVIDRVLEGSEARLMRMRKRGGAGVRVRPPGTRLKAPKVEPARPTPVVHRPLPASLFEVPPGRPTPPPVEPAWHAPAPRLMGLSLEKGRASTPAGGTALPRELPAVHAPPPAPVTQAAPAAVSLDGLPDLPGAVPSSAFEQVPTDVDLLRAVDNALAVEDERGSAAFERRKLVDVTGPVPAFAAPTPAPVPTPDDEPRAAADEPVMVSDDDVSPVDEDSTGNHEVSISKLPSLEEADFHTAEHPALIPSSAAPSAADWEGRTEHGLDGNEATAEASEPDRTVLPRPLPVPVAWPTSDPRSTRPIGIAFMVARRASEPVGLEVLTWPASGTKRVGALDEARAQGGEALDQAIASSAWLARDASAGAPSTDHSREPYFDPGLTDPGHRVVDVVGAAVEAAASEPDEGEVFSERHGRTAAAANPALDEQTVAEEMEPGPAPPDDDPATLVGDDTADNVRAAAPLLPDDEVETDRALQRRPSETSTATRNRLGVLQRFLGKR